MGEETSLLTPPEILSPEPPVRVIKKLHVLGGLVAFLLLLIGVYLLNRQLQPKSPSQPEPKVTELISPTPTFDLKAAQRPNTQEEFYYQIGQNIKKILE